MEHSAEFTLQDIFLILKNHFLFILTLTVLLGISGYLGSKYFITPKYESSATLIVNTNASKETSYSDITFSQKLVDIYSVILKNQSLLEKVVYDLNIPVDPASLANNITISNVDSTGILKIYVRDTNPVRAKTIADKIVELAPDEINRTVKIGSVNLISPAQNAYYISPDNKKNMLIGTITGFILSLIITFLLELTNNKFKTKEDIKNKTGYSVLGIIPFFNKKDNYFKDDPDQTSKKTTFQITESLNSILMNLKYTTLDKPAKKILVTSSINGEGKTTVALNLALSLEQLNNKVLLIDMDFRKSNSRKLFKFQNTNGVTSILTNDCILSEAIIHSDDLKIDILPSGPIPPNPIVQLHSGKLESVFSELDKLYDYILIDTPPVSVFSDVLTLLPLSDGVIFVIRQSYTTFENAINASNQFTNIKANIFGCVLNSYKSKKVLNHV